MSVLMAVHSSADGKTWIASDSRWVWGGSYRDNFGLKFACSTGIAIGSAGPGRIFDVIAAEIEDIAGPVADFSIQRVVQRLRGALGRHEIALLAKENRSCPEFEAAFIVATENAVFVVTGTLNVVRLLNDEIIAIGSGEDLAEGAYKAFRLCGRGVEESLRASIEIAIGNELHCGGEAIVRTVNA